MEGVNLSALVLVLIYLFVCSFVVGVFCDVTNSSDVLLCTPSLHLPSAGKVFRVCFLPVRAPSKPWGKGSSLPEYKVSPSRVRGLLGSPSKGELIPHFLSFGSLLSLAFTLGTTFPC